MRRNSPVLMAAVAVLVQSGFAQQPAAPPAGRTPAALEHLRRAIELSEEFRSYAKDDSDFDPIREDPAFKELVGG